MKRYFDLIGKRQCAELTIEDNTPACIASGNDFKEFFNCDVREISHDEYLWLKDDYCNNDFTKVQNESNTTDDIKSAIIGLSTIKNLVSPILRKYNYEDLGKEDEKEFKYHFDLAISALKKQMPKKSTKLYKSYLGDGNYGECPNCGHTGLKQYAHECCWWCGQKIDWSGKMFSK